MPLVLDNGEIVIMMPGSSRAEAARTAKRMQASTSNCMLPVMDRELTVAFNHGIAELQPNETAHELIARARSGDLDAFNDDSEFSYQSLQKEFEKTGHQLAEPAAAGAPAEPK